jgi:hypothetical protein
MIVTLENRSSGVFFLFLTIVVIKKPMLKRQQNTKITFRIPAVRLIQSNPQVHLNSEIASMNFKAFVPF